MGAYRAGLTPTPKKLREFLARNEQGVERRICVVQNVVKHHNVEDGTVTEEEPIGDPYVSQTPGDPPLERIAKGKYRVPGTGEILTSDDPEAP
jgi:hypothetical protein